ncbi:MAG: V-type ATP synthase subunit K [Treponema sp.]|jgi:V/A-type H+-transporting ATPase subunit K|nr:V-type ATP synthase subunit K [Treponema sp.]
MLNLGLLGAGLVMGISTVGSGFGIGYAGQATIGAWKKCYIANKAAPMMLLAFAGAPLTQTFYGFILMGQMVTAASANPESGWLYVGFGLASGLAIGFSAVFQGKVGAAAADAQAETGKGFAQYIAVVGIAETVALFAMVLTMISL